MTDLQPEDRHGPDEPEQAQSSADNVNDLRLPNRPAPDRSCSMLAADADLGLAACLIETIKDIPDLQGRHQTRTTVDQNHKGNRLRLQIDYQEQEGRTSFMRAKLSINGEQFVPPSVVRAGQRPGFPIAVRETDLKTGEPGTLKMAIHDAIHEFRKSGSQGFLNHFDELQIEGAAQKKINHLEQGAKDFTLIGNICELARLDFQSRSDSLDVPYGSIDLQPSQNIGLSIEHSSGLRMSFNFLPIDSSTQERRYLLQQVRLSLPAEGWSTRVPFTAKNESYYIDARWEQDTADLSDPAGQVRELIKIYNELLIDYTSDRLAKVPEYFSEINGYHGTYPETLHARVALWRRPSRENEERENL